MRGSSQKIHFPENLNVISELFPPVTGDFLSLYSVFLCSREIELREIITALKSPRSALTLSMFRSISDNFITAILVPLVASFPDAKNWPLL